MAAIYLVCLIGGLAATALLAALGMLTGTIGHGLHLGSGHGVGHLPAGHGAAHLPIAHTTSQLHAGAQTHALPAHGGQSHVSGHPTPAQHGQSGVAPAMAQTPGPLAAALGWTLSWLSPLTIAAGVLWFGGGGLLAGLAAPALAFPVAIVAALVGAGLVRALMSAFSRADTAPLQATATGAMGELSAPIRIDALGEVIYTLEGLHRSAPARSLDGTPLPRGTQVVIVRRERGIAYVSPLDPLEPLLPGAPTPSVIGPPEPAALEPRKD